MRERIPARGLAAGRHGRQGGIMKNWLAGVLIAAAALAVAAPAAAQAPVIVVNLVELTGPGTIAGSNFNNGVLLAFKEINASGGILGQRVQVVTFDTQSNPDLAKALAQRAVALQPYAVMGPVFSGITLAAMDEMQRASIPTFTGGEAAEITAKGNPFIFRTSLTQTSSMPRFAQYMKDVVKSRSVAIVWIDNPFGKGGRDEMVKALGAQGIKVAADIGVAQGQKDYAAIVQQVMQSKADTAFVYLNEDEAARCLLELRKQEFPGWVVGETTVAGQQVIDLAGEAANGVRAHVGLTAHALIPTVRTFDNNFLREYRYRSDHNGMKGYIAVYVLKAVTEKIGKFDSKALAAAMSGLSLSAQQYPGILLDVKYNDKGDLDRTSFVVRVAQGRHEFLATLPAASTTVAATPAAGKK
jgi:branched-chain amino acid transport system substrate-binding protein